MLSLNQSYTYELSLLKGTKVLWGTRSPENRHKVAIECRGCFKDVGQVKYVLDKQIQSYVRGVLGVYAILLCRQAEEVTPWCRLWVYLKGIAFWDELCPDCCRVRGKLDKFTTDQVAPSGTVTYFSEEKDGRVRVAYINSQIGCDCERWVKRDCAVSHWHKYPAVCRFHHNNPVIYAELIQARQAKGNSQKIGGAEKKPRGGARNVKWTPEQEQEFLVRYEEALPKIKRRDNSIPNEALAELLLPGNSPSDVARDYVARQMGVESNDYLKTLITRARKRREQNTLHSKPGLNVA